MERIQEMLINDECLVQLTDDLDEDYGSHSRKLIDLAVSQTTVNPGIDRANFFDFLKDIAALYAASIFRLPDSHQDVPWIKFRFANGPIDFNLTFGREIDSDLTLFADEVDAQLLNHPLYQIRDILAATVNPRCQGITSIDGVRESDYRRGAWTVLLHFGQEMELSAHDTLELIERIHGWLTKTACMSPLDADQIISGFFET